MKTDLTPPKETKFSAAIEENIRCYICRAKRNGTVAMSEANLLQCVPSPSPFLEGAPQGTNAAWYYRQLFSEACKLKGIREFIPTV